MDILNFRPLKAPSEAIPDSFLPKLRFPLYASPKYDGLRTTNLNGKAVTSSVKPVRNRHTAALMELPPFRGFDGEMQIGDGADPTGFGAATTAVMAEHAVVQPVWQVFDLIENHQAPYQERYEELVERVTAVQCTYGYFIKVVPQTIINNLNELNEYEKAVLDGGFEGAMIRDPRAAYKFGRSTMNQQILLKLKRGHEKRDDAVIIGFTEQVQNNNPPYINERGLQQRAQNKEFLVGKNTLGSFQVRDEQGREFSIGIGVEGTFDDAFRQKVWNDREAWLGKTIRYTWFDYGGYELPRHPKYVGIRHPEDMTDV